MACERCIDIHKAQATGARIDECPCKCHKNKNKVIDTSGNTAILNMTGTTSNVTLNDSGSFT